MSTPTTREITTTTIADADNFADGLTTGPTIGNPHDELENDPQFAYQDSISPLDTPYM